MESTLVGIDRHFFRENKLEIWLSNHKIHLISWSVFIFWECIIIGLIHGAFGNFFNYAIHYSLNIFLFYFHTWLIEKAIKVRKHRIWRTPLFIIAELAGYVIIVFNLDNFLATHTNLLSGSLDTDKKRVLILLWRSLYFMFFSSGYFFLLRYLKERKERENSERLSSEMKLEKEKTENALMISRNAFLKAQINPHLLFNTFEFLHNKMKIIAPEHAKLMVYLAQIVRFSAQTNFHEGLVRLGDEITQCENLVNIFKITQHKIFIKISYSEDVLKLNFIPLVVITLLENILKHGEISDGSNFSGIDLYIVEGTLKIESFNPFSSNKDRKGFGSGLENIRNRLSYAYGDSFTMTVRNDPNNIFRVELAVPIHLLVAQEYFPY